MVKLNQPYIHYKNKKTYSPIGLCKIQEHGRWVTAVLYIEMYVEPDDPYVRSLAEFQAKFKLDEK